MRGIEKMKNKLSPSALGLSALLLSQLVFSVVIFYWKQVTVDSLQTLASRMLWSFVFSGLCILIFDKSKEYKKILADKKALLAFFGAGLLISVNWGTYLYAVASNNVIESSMGYYINPLLISLAGLFIYKEPRTKTNLIAIALGFIGVAYMTVQYGKPPVIALVLAFSYTCYSLVIRKYPAKPYTGMFFQTMIMLPMAIGYNIYLFMNGTSAYLDFGSSVQPLFLIGAGLITVTPLMLYSVGMKRAPMTIVGFTSYISPTLTLLISVFCYGEEFTSTHAVTFFFIWAGVLVFSIGNYIRAKKQNKSA